MTAQTLWITTDRFKSTTPGEEFINSRCFSEDFAEWLLAYLRERNYEVSEPVKEDFGWVLLVVLAERTFTISIGITVESIGKIPATWCIAGWTWIGVYLRPSVAKKFLCQQGRDGGVNQLNQPPEDRERCKPSYRT